MSPIPECWVRSAKSTSKHSSHLSDLKANKTFQNASSRWSIDTVRSGENHYRKRSYSLGWKNRGTLTLLGKAGRCPMKESFAPSEELISVRPPSAPSYGRHRRAIAFREGPARGTNVRGQRQISPQGVWLPGSPAGAGREASCDGSGDCPCQGEQLSTALPSAQAAPPGKGPQKST